MTHEEAVKQIAEFLKNKYHSGYADDKEVQSGLYDEDTPITFGALRALLKPT